MIDHGIIYKLKINNRSVYKIQIINKLSMKPFKQNEISSNQTTNIRILPFEKDQPSQPSNQQIQLLLECMKNLNKKINSLPTNKTLEQIEERFISIKIDIPPISSPLSISGKKKIQQWLSQLCEKVFSRGFKLYHEEKFNKKKMRTFCCENLIHSILSLIQKNCFKNEEIKYINDCLRKEIIPHLLSRYPKSEDPEINLRLQNLIRRVDNFENNENDLVAKSGVKFEWKQSGVYFSEIMKFMKFIIELPNETISEKQKISLGESFESDMETFFTTVFDKKCVNVMQSFNIKDAKQKKQKEDREYQCKLQRKQSKEKEKNQKNPFHYRKREELDDYSKDHWDKAKQYTNFEISRKMSKNTLSFNSKEIEEEMIKIKSTTIMRILIKWCEELENSLEPENLYNREEPFRLTDDSEMFLSIIELGSLAKYLEQQKIGIKKQKEKILQNNYDQQWELSIEQFQREFAYLPPSECKVGLFSSIMLKNNKFYIIKYLNLLIHRLLSAMKKYKGNYQNVFPPQLISFKIGDLLRCRCTSKENEIIALYNQIERINLYHPEILKIVKIKNKLHTQTKNILMNLLYRNRMVVEIQLGINSDKSRFIKCSNDMNHLIYELQRARFGPITELSNIWMASDTTRAEFYEEKRKEMENQKYLQRQSYKCEQLSKKSEKNLLPFKCKSCGNYENKIRNNQQKEVKCKNICFYCRIQSIENYSEMQIQFPSLPKETKEGQYEIVKGERCTKQEVPDYGLAVSIKEKKKECRRFRKVNRKSKDLLMEIREKQGKNVYNLMDDINSQKSLKKLFRNNLIVEIKDQNIKKEIQNITSEQKLSQQYFVPKILNQSIKNEKITLSLENQHVKDETLTTNIEKEFSHIKKINFMFNKITDLSTIGRLFNKVQIAILGANKIKKISDCFCEKLRDLTTLYLEGNPIEEIPPSIEKLTNLRQLNLFGNKIQKISPKIQELLHLRLLNLAKNRSLKEFPNQFCELQNLEQLIIYGSAVQKLPENINSLKNLRMLMAHQTKLQNIPQKFSQCKNIEKIYFHRTQLSQFQINMSEWKKITELHLSQTKISKLPDSITDCTSLRRLTVGRCAKISLFPGDFSNLSNLHQLQFQFTQIEKLPSMEKLTNLSRILLNHTKLKIIPCGIGCCSNLEQLYLQNTLISDIPEQIKNLCNLRYLRLSSTKIQLSESNVRILLNCRMLSELYLDDLSLSTLPSNFSQFNSLCTLNLSNNKFTQIPSQIFSLTGLNYLYLEKNRISEISEQIQKLQKLRQLYLCGNPVKILPKILKKLKNLKELSVDQQVQNIPFRIGLQIIYNTFF